MFFALSPTGCELVRASFNGRILDFDEIKEIMVKKVKKLIPKCDKIKQFLSPKYKKIPSPQKFMWI